MNARVRNLPVSQWDEFNPAHRNKVRRGVIYDTLTYVAAGHDKLAFFRDPYGSGGKTRFETNLEDSGRLAHNQRMLVDGIQILFTPGLLPGRSGANVAAAIVNDMHAFYSAGLAAIKVGSDEVLTDGPLGLFPGETRLIGDIAMQDDFTADDNKATAVELVHLAGKQYDLEPFLWKGGQNLDLSLLWEGGKVVLPSGVDGKVRIRLLGNLAEVK